MEEEKEKEKESEDSCIKKKRNVLIHVSLHLCSVYIKLVFAWIRAFLLSMFTAIKRAFAVSSAYRNLLSLFHDFLTLYSSPSHSYSSFGPKLNAFAE